MFEICTYKINKFHSCHTQTLYNGHGNMQNLDEIEHEYIIYNLKCNK